jgi:hypothetical protein
MRQYSWVPSVTDYHCFSLNYISKVFIIFIFYISRAIARANHLIIVFLYLSFCPLSLVIVNVYDLFWCCLYFMTSVF